MSYWAHSLVGRDSRRGSRIGIEANTNRSGHFFFPIVSRSSAGLDNSCAGKIKGARKRVYVCPSQAFFSFAFLPISLLPLVSARVAPTFVATTRHLNKRGIKCSPKLGTAPSPKYLATRGNIRVWPFLPSVIPRRRGYRRSSNNGNLFTRHVL